MRGHAEISDALLTWDVTNNLQNCFGFLERRSSFHATEMPAKSLICEKVTAGELARVLGVSRKHVYTLLDRGLPRDGRLFDLADCVQWMLDDLRQELKTKEPENIMEARLALYVAQTEKLGLENAKLRREHVELEEAKQVLLGVASIVAGQLDALAPRTAPQVLGLTSVLEIQDILVHECRDVRAAIARQVGKLDPAGAEDYQPAPSSDSGAMGGRKARATSRKSRTRPLEK